MAEQGFYTPLARVRFPLWVPLQNGRTRMIGVIGPTQAPATLNS